MGRPVKHVLLAPVVIAIATSIVLPANTTLSSVSEWLANGLAPAPVTVSFQIEGLTDGPPSHPLFGAARESPSDATVYASDTTPAAASDAWTAAMSTANDRLAHVLVSSTAIISSQYERLSDLPFRATWTAISVAANERLSEFLAATTTAVASLQNEWLSEDLLPAESDKDSAVAWPDEKWLYANLAASKIDSQPPSVEIAPAALDELKIAPVIVPAVETATAAPDPLPIKEPKITRENKPEEKQVYASLNSPLALSDAGVTAPAPLPPEEARAANEYNPNGTEPEEKPLDYASDSSLSLAPVRSPLKLRALTRADVPPADKLVSLGTPATQNDIVGSNEPSVVPPEKQRVAYDAPVTEQPKSIGKRRSVDDTKYTGLGSPEALLEALRHMGANAKTLGLPASLWCADFMNLVLRKSGLKATGSRAAKSYLEYGKKIDEPRVGAIAIFTRGKNGGHIGIVRGTDGAGNPIIVSGNHNNIVAEATYPKSRVLAYVVPR